VTFSFQNNSHSSILQAATLTNGYFPKNETGPPIKSGPLLIIQIITLFLKKASVIRIILPLCFYAPFLDLGDKDDYIVQKTIQN
jgi:hypothetical protein